MVVEFVDPRYKLICGSEVRFSIGKRCMFKVAPVAVTVTSTGAALDSATTVTGKRVSNKRTRKKIFRCRITRGHSDSSQV